MGLVLTDVLGFGGDLARVGHTRLGAGAQHGTLDNYAMTDVRCRSGTLRRTVRESGFRKGIRRG